MKMKDDGDDDRLRMVIVILAMNVPKQTRKLMNAMMIMTAKAFETMTTMIPATKPPLTMNLLVLLLLPLVLHNPAVGLSSLLLGFSLSS